MNPLFFLFEKDITSTDKFYFFTEFKTTWKDCIDKPIVIEKCSPSLLTASEITFETTADSSQIDKKTWKDLKKVLLAQMKGNVYCQQNVVFVEFFNKTFSFKIRYIKEHTYQEVFEDLEEKMKHLNMSDYPSKSTFCCLVNRNTKLEIQLDEMDITTSSNVKPPILTSIGGLDSIVNELKDAMNVAFGNTKTLPGFQVPRTVLLHGHHGSGKSLLCDALAEESDALVIKINASEIFSKYFGESEANLLNQFEKAYKNYPKPSIIIIEEISSICAKEMKEESAKRIQSAFLNILDSIHVRQDSRYIFVIATTSNIENINSTVRRYGRLDIEIEIPVPDPIAREQILIKQLQKLQHTLSSQDIRTIANNCHGYVGADLSSLVAKAAMHAVSRAPTMETTPITEPVLALSDIQYAFAHVVPSAMKEVLIKCPNVKWSDIGGQDELKLQLRQAIEWPLTHPETFTRLGINPTRGVLMFGPPGCSKTMIAKALATECKVNFLSIKGPELFSMWVGESERAVRELFRKARQVSPAIIFFDEIDAIGGERSASASGSSVKERVLAQLLTEMDGVNVLNNVTIVAATNRPDLIDNALMRPGRLDRIVYVRLPDADTRREIFQIKLSKMPLVNDFSIEQLVSQTDGYSGAEIQAICQEAALYALEESFEAKHVEWKHFEKALKNVKPRTSSELLKIYDEYLTEHSTS